MCGGVAEGRTRLQEGLRCVVVFSHDLIHNVSSERDTPGVVPDELTLLERVARFYKQHDPPRVAAARAEVAEAQEYDAEDVLLARLKYA